MCPRDSDWPDSLFTIATEGPDVELALSWPQRTHKQKLTRHEWKSFLQFLRDSWLSRGRGTVVTGFDFDRNERNWNFMDHRSAEATYRKSTPQRGSLPKRQPDPTLTPEEERRRRETGVGESVHLCKGTVTMSLPRQWFVRIRAYCVDLPHPLPDKSPVLRLPALKSDRQR